jgi:hypothetical protein
LAAGQPDLPGRHLVGTPKEVRIRGAATPLERVLDAYQAHDNEHRPHRGLSLASPLQSPPERAGPIRRHHLLGGLIHEYHRAVA